MITENKFVKRLLEEWKLHGKIIIAVDFDDTISPWKFNSEEDKEDMDEVIKLLKQCKYTGAYVTIFTACNSDRFPEITEYCLSKGLVVDSMNANPIDLPYGNHGKVYANIFIDDRAGLKEALAILETAMYQFRGWMQSQGYTVQNFDF